MTGLRKMSKVTKECTKNKKLIEKKKHVIGSKNGAV